MTGDAVGVGVGTVVVVVVVVVGVVIGAGDCVGLALGSFGCEEVEDSLFLPWECFLAEGEGLGEGETGTVEPGPAADVPFPGVRDAEALGEG